MKVNNYSVALFDRTLKDIFDKMSPHPGRFVSSCWWRVMTHQGHSMLALSMTCQHAASSWTCCVYTHSGTMCRIWTVWEHALLDSGHVAFTRWELMKDDTQYQRAFHALLLDVVFSVTYICTWQALSQKYVLPDFNQSKLCLFHMWTSCLNIQVNHSHYSPVYFLVALSVSFLLLFNWHWPLHWFHYKLCQRYSLLSVTKFGTIS